MNDDLFIEIRAASDSDDIARKNIALRKAHDAITALSGDTRWATNVLLEKIAEKFEGWATWDIWRSDAAMVVRGFKNDATARSQIPGAEISRGYTETEIRLLGLLERTRTILGNMAAERDGFWNSLVGRRWPVNHEPLRNDARNLLPLIDAEIEGGNRDA